MFFVCGAGAHGCRYRVLITTQNWDWEDLVSSRQGLSNRAVMYPHLCTVRRARKWSVNWMTSSRTVDWKPVGITVYNFYSASKNYTRDLVFSYFTCDAAKLLACSSKSLETIRDHWICVANVSVALPKIFAGFLELYQRPALYGNAWLWETMTYVPLCRFRAKPSQRNLSPFPLHVNCACFTMPKINMWRGAVATRLLAAERLRPREAPSTFGLLFHATRMGSMLKYRIQWGMVPSPRSAAYGLGSSYYWGEIRTYNTVYLNFYETITFIAE